MVVTIARESHCILLLRKLQQWEVARSEFGKIINEPYDLRPKTIRDVASSEEFRGQKDAVGNGGARRLMEKKIHFEYSFVVKAPKEKVFKIWQDFESAPKWSTTLKSAKVVKRDGNMVYVETSSTMMGRSVTGHQKHTLQSPDRDEVESTSNAGSARQILTIESVPDGTRIVMIAEFEPKGILGRFFALASKGKIDSMFRAETESFSRYAEQVVTSS